MGHELPSRVPGYLLRLWHQYQRTNNLLAEIVASSRVRVIEETEYDGWDGGTYAHDVVLYIPLDLISKIDVDDLQGTRNQIAEDMRKLSASVRREHIGELHLEVADENDENFRRATPFSGRPKINPDGLSIWKPGHVRVFISHRDEKKGDAHFLANELEAFGFSSFVAHDSIPANEEWRKVIIGGLETMEIMLVFLTDDFEKSIWTMQEVGFALGKGIPTVSLKLEKRDPPGFISHAQALKGSLDNLSAAARRLAPLLAKALGQQDRLQAALVSSFVSSPSWGETRDRFDRLAEMVEKLSASEVNAIIEGFRKNDQLYGATYLTTNGHTRLLRFLKKATGSDYEVRGRNISEALPF